MLSEFGNSIASWKLIPGGGGAFEVIVNGDLVFSKLKIGRHAEHHEIREALQRKLKQSA
jgi:selT/selW/selH-like putative selenoprotein